MNEQPLDADEIEGALSRCVRRDSEALAVVALPWGCAPFELVSKPQSWAWRGCEQPHGADRIASLAELVARCHRGDDRYVDPAAPPWSWVRPIRSGAGLVVFGAEAVLGAPALTADASVSPGEIHEFARAFVLGEVGEPPAVFHNSCSTLLVCGDRHRWHLTTSDAPHHDVRAEPSSTAERAAALAEHLGDQLGVPLEVRTASDGLLVLWATLDAARHTATVEVPVRCVGGVTSVGWDAREVHDIGTVDPVAREAARAWGLTPVGQHGDKAVVALPDGTLGLLSWQPARP